MSDCSSEAMKPKERKTCGTFKMSGQDVFGKYCNIKFGFAIGGKQDYHIFKCVQSLRSNTYCDVPITAHSYRNKRGEIHDEVVDVVRVIECGIEEVDVLNVALDDIEFVALPNTLEQCYQQLEQVTLWMYDTMRDHCAEAYSDEARERLESLGVRVDEK